MLFGKKSRLAPEERQALEKDDGAGLAMACFYTMGENVREDYTAANTGEGTFHWH